MRSNASRLSLSVTSSSVPVDELEQSLGPPPLRHVA
jgi:hypothetical protein